MKTLRLLVAAAAALVLAACGTPPRPASWAAPAVLVSPSSFTGVHALAVDAQGRLLAGTVVGHMIRVVDHASGVAVSDDGTVHFGAGRDHAIYRVRPQP
jgi:hypothetical protein